MPDHTEDSVDDVIEQIADAIEQIPGLELATPEELEAVLATGREAAAAHDAQAMAEGRRFLDEEQDRELIETWFAEAEKCESPEAAFAFAHRLMTDYRHDYGTICHAIAAGAVAMANGMNRAGGHITGFQAGFVSWGFLKHWNGWADEPRRIQDFSHLLFPQYDHTWTRISKETADWLQASAKDRLVKIKARDVHPDVRARWLAIARGIFPDFISVEDQP